MPVQDKPPKCRPAHPQRNPVAIECTAFSRRRHVIERVEVVRAGEPAGLQAGAQQHPEFARADPPDIPRITRQRQVDMMKFDALAPCQSVDQRLHHQALSVDWRGSLGEDK